MIIPLSLLCDCGCSTFIMKYSGGGGFPGGASGKDPPCQCRRHKRHGFDSWVGKIPWRRKWQPTPVFLPGKSHRQRSLMGYNLWGCRVGDDRVTEHSFQTYRKVERCPFCPWECWECSWRIGTGSFSPGKFFQVSNGVFAQETTLSPKVTDSVCIRRKAFGFSWSLDSDPVMFWQVWW